MRYDQHYFAKRVSELGIGIAHETGTPKTGSLTHALEFAIQPEVRSRASSVAASMHTDGAEIAARRLIDLAESRHFN